MAGNKYLRVSSSTITDGIEKVRASFIFKLPDFKFLKEAIEDVIPTIKSECVVALSGVTPNKYTKIGTANMEPPLPISPSEIPINSDSM